MNWKRFASLLCASVACLSLAACVVVRKPSPAELDALNHPPPSVVARVDRLSPLALNWYEGLEKELLPQGRPLTQPEKQRARALGVLDPGRVRVVVMDPFPLPQDPVLRTEARRYGLGSAFEGGRTVGHAILIKPRYRNNSTILSHELVHVSQIDRMGRRGFLRRYLTEVEMLGHARAPLEMEAYEKQGPIH
jgi:hypothetical protein